MFGLAQLVVMAERDLRDTAVKANEESHLEAQVWLWRYKKKLLLVGGVLAALLIIGGKGA